MSQNKSSAVMQQRSEPHKSLDDFPTPPWATRALCEDLHSRHLIQNQTCREPAANRGHMVRPLEEWFDHVVRADIFDYGAGYPVQDYLFGPPPSPVDWTITNPPFRLAEQFIDRALPTVALGEPEVVRYGFDGYGWKYMDAGSGSDWLGRAMAEPDAEPLYDSPASQPDPRDAVIVQLVNTVNFYADWDNWMLDAREVSLIGQDEGKLARNTLRIIKGLKNE